MTDRELRQRYPALWLMTCDLDADVDPSVLAGAEPQLLAVMRNDEPKVRRMARAELEQLIKTTGAGVS